MKLSIVIPAYNEETRISRTLEKTINYLNSQKFDSEIIVVCDGNTDKTHLIAKDFSTIGNVSLHVHRYKKNKCYY